FAGAKPRARAASLSAGVAGSSGSGASIEAGSICSSCSASSFGGSGANCSSSGTSGWLEAMTTTSSASLSASAPFPEERSLGSVIIDNLLADGSRAARRRYPDFIQRRLLEDAHHAQLRHLENRQEGDDDVNRFLPLGEEDRESNLRRRREAVGDRLDRVADRYALGDDLVGDDQLRPLQRLVQKVHELDHRDFGEPQLPLFEWNRRRAGVPAEHVALVQISARELLGGVPVLL